MEWTAAQLRQLCVDNNVEFTGAAATFGGRFYSIGGETFTLRFVDGTHPHKDSRYEFQAEDHCHKGEKKLSIKLATYLSASQVVEKDTYDGWSAAFRAALDSTEYKLCKKYGGFSGVINAFETLLVKELETLGKVKKAKRKTFHDTFVVRGVGAVQFWNSHTADKLYVGPHKGDDAGRGWGEIEFKLFKDNLEEKAKEVVALLRGSAVKAGTLNATATAEPSPADFAKVASEVVFDDYVLDTGDKRTCGSLECTWKTPFGELVYQCVFNSSGDTQEDSWRLNNEPLIDNQKEWEQLAVDLDLQPPHYYFGDKAEESWREQFDGSILSALLEIIWGTRSRTGTQCED
jgi:hypothetical protein